MSMVAKYHAFQHIFFTPEFLGFENYIPPFATARDQEILQGLNYASGAVGIREESGQQVIIYPTDIHRVNNQMLRLSPMPTMHAKY
jgi:hypothetical protein